jgi:predicted transcriptional regulator of viral defense system
MASPSTDRVVEAVRRLGVARSRELGAVGVPRTYLHRLTAKGILERVSRGLYHVADDDFSENYTLAQASKRVPRGVVCLLSALQFHGMTTQSPFEIWMAIDQKARRPVVDYPPLRIFRFSGESLQQGVTTHTLDGVAVRIYNAAKTVADCFKFRNKVGLDVALEALRDYRRARLGTLDELWRFATVCRVAQVMRPYMEAMEWAR